MKVCAVKNEVLFLISMLDAHDAASFLIKMTFRDKTCTHENPGHSRGTTPVAGSVFYKRSS